MGLSEAEYGTTDITEEKAEQKDKQSSTKPYIENQIKVCNNDIFALFVQCKHSSLLVPDSFRAIITKQLQHSVNVTGDILEKELQ